MTLEINNLKYLFENINDGCVLAFYRQGFLGSIIPFFTKENKGDKAPNHCGIVYEVKKTSALCKFKISEQGFHGGQYREIKIFKYRDIYYTTDEYFLKQKEIKMLQVKMTEKQIDLGITDAIKQIGKKYGYTKLILGAEFIERILPIEWQRKLFWFFNKSEKLRVCSTHVQFNLIHCGIDLPKDTFYSPLEITKLNIYS